MLSIVLSYAGAQICDQTIRFAAEGGNSEIISLFTANGGMWFGVSPNFGRRVGF